jgi:hypothetical protein
MGRYYYGDIEGKFWFAVQSSDSADRFGVIGATPSYLEYWFSDSDLESVQQELKNIENNLGENLIKMDEFFKDNAFYNDEDLAEFLGLSLDTTKYLLRDYADYTLGKKIEQSILEKGECSFTAEL